ncbi:YitT family protein [Reinekea blandensis]|uniref:YitT family protein n=1 Tax=Reinekea blandensis MED297 TaxID=314283 RepID=A4BFH5_9GAMM|nr:YitT family protein [Reinekea blandensis]EAR09070.1 hypothetical protein MED297_17048 [Reinekea sp. MED297] [Reinekea blandensis MED297]
MKPQNHHSIPEDLLALITASLMVAFGIYLFKQCGFLTGGTAGIALILTQLTPFSFGQIFFTINLPFYYLAWTRMGRRFTLNTFISVAVVSLFSDNLHRVIQVSDLNPVYSAIFGGLLVGMGILIMFRHVSSLGGLGVLAKFVQDRFQISAGKFQMSIDVSIVCIGFFLVSPWVLALSVLGAVALNLVIAINHKPGRYQIT